MPSYEEAARLQRVRRDIPGQVCLASVDGETAAEFTERQSKGEYQKMKNQPKPVPVRIPRGAETNLREMLNRDRIDRALARRSRELENIDG